MNKKIWIIVKLKSALISVFYKDGLDEIVNIIQNTSMQELIEMQRKCYDWIRENSELIRVNIIASLKK
jgi:hypothetical protein